MHAIRIKKNTSIGDIERGWPAFGQKEVLFKISNQSSFEILAEGVALGFLRDLVIGETQIKIEIYTPPILNNEKVFEGVCPILKSIFGLELLRVCESITDRRNNILDIRNLIGNRYGTMCSGKKGPLRMASRYI